MYTHESAVRLPDTDAAGILYFGNYFTVAHDAYEAFLASIGFSFAYIISEADFLILIAHAEADYRRPLLLGEKITVEVAAEQIGHSSFALTYLLKDSRGEVAANVKTVHVSVEKSTGKKMPLPASLREKLEAIR